MDNSNFASGDNTESQSKPLSPTVKEDKINDTRSSENGKNEEEIELKIEDELKSKTDDDKVVEIHENNENRSDLVERIGQCRSIIESLKLQLNQEKARITQESKVSHYIPPEPETSNYSTPSDIYGGCIDSKLACDENLMEYEKQLEKYQNTLNMAQLEKKNAIRKQMLARAFKLKLMELENQCNIELLRVKQSLQCLKPLQMIANNWKSSSDNINYDFTNFELIPRYPDLNSVSVSEDSSMIDENESKITKTPV
ncbi:uncharacterized protein LOC126967231 [Leptidea sinapis]|uniref:uncharacterized protein LOC126967231 n=1 Tax=Leptidea sinapis TaxID=189913 RepID=UPI0021C4B00D|nr:uncharacterized protein LOC126967231 [Leptidea sinapis]